MKIETKVKSKVDFKKVKKKTEQANFESVKHAVASVRQHVLSTIHSGKVEKLERQQSKPGDVPKRWKNRSGRTIKTSQKQSKNILFTKPIKGSDGRTSTTLHASPHQSGDRVFQMLERGGSQQIKMYPDKLTYEELRAFDTYKKLVGKRNRRDRAKGWKKNHWKPFSERSEKEIEAIKSYYKNIAKNATLASAVDKISKDRTTKVTKTGKYKPRPFMMPAVKRLLPQFPKIWKTYIQKTYR